MAGPHRCSAFEVYQLLSDISGALGKSSAGLTGLREKLLLMDKDGSGSLIREGNVHLRRFNSITDVHRAPSPFGRLLGVSEEAQMGPRAAQPSSQYCTSYK